MSEDYQGNSGTAKEQGTDLKQQLGQHAGLIGGVLIIAGAAVSLTMAIKKVQKLALWLIPTALYVAGVILVAKPLQKRKERIHETEEEIVTMLGQLDPVAKAQVVSRVAKAELAKG